MSWSSAPCPAIGPAGEPCALVTGHTGPHVPRPAWPTADPTQGAMPPASAPGSTTGAWPPPAPPPAPGTTPSPSPTLAPLPTPTPLIHGTLNYMADGGWDLWSSTDVCF